MKTSGTLIAAAAMAFMGLQGCASSGGTQQQASSHWAATGADSAISTSDSSDKAVVKADTKDNFEAVVAAVHKQMAPGGRWQYANADERGTIDGSFADMGKLYDQFGSVDKMDQNAKVRLLADQSTVNSILTKKDGDRLICQSHVPVGSHLPIKTCQTYAQIQAEQRQTQRDLERLNQQQRYQIAH